MLRKTITLLFTFLLTFVSASQSFALINKDYHPYKNIITHAVLGCALGEAMAKDCGSGAAGAALSAAIAPHIAKGVDTDGNGLDDEEKKQVRSLSQIASAFIAGAASKDVDVANYTALNEIENNVLNHALGVIKGAGVEGTIQILKAMADGMSLADAVASLDMSEIGKATILDGITSGVGGVKNVQRMAKAYEKYKKGKGKIKGHTKHGLHQSIGRDGGKGVSAAAKTDAVKNPVKVVPQSGGRIKYVGKDATVVTNRDGKVITTYGKSRSKK